MPKSETNTPDVLNRRIRVRTVDALRHALDGGRSGIDDRLRELDKEWDVERVLETAAASFTLAGVTLALTVDRRWLALPGVVAGFLLQHAVQGWCPPLPIVRAFRVRTSQEIEHERNALKAARGDFDAMSEARAAGPNTLLAVTEP